MSGRFDMRMAVQQLDLADVRIRATVNSTVENKVDLENVEIASDCVY